MSKVAPKIQCSSLALSLNIEHLTLAGQTVTLLNQRVNILATFQHTLNLEQCLRAING